MASYIYILGVHESSIQCCMAYFYLLLETLSQSYGRRKLGTLGKVYDAVESHNVLPDR